MNAKDEKDILYHAERTGVVNSINWIEEILHTSQWSQAFEAGFQVAFQQKNLHVMMLLLSKYADTTATTTMKAIYCDSVREACRQNDLIVVDTLLYFSMRTADFSPSFWSHIALPLSIETLQPCTQLFSQLSTLTFSSTPRYYRRSVPKQIMDSLKSRLKKVSSLKDDIDAHITYMNIAISLGHHELIDLMGQHYDISIDECDVQKWKDKETFHALLFTCKGNYTKRYLASHLLHPKKTPREAIDVIQYIYDRFRFYFELEMIALATLNYTIHTSDYTVFNWSIGFFKIQNPDDDIYMMMYKVAIRHFINYSKKGEEKASLSVGLEITKRILDLSVHHPFESIEMLEFFQYHYLAYHPYRPGTSERVWPCHLQKLNAILDHPRFANPIVLDILQRKMANKSESMCYQFLFYVVIERYIFHHKIPSKTIPIQLLLDAWSFACDDVWCGVFRSMIVPEIQKHPDFRKEEILERFKASFTTRPSQWAPKPEWAPMHCILSFPDMPIVPHLIETFQKIETRSKGERDYTHSSSYCRQGVGVTVPLRINSIILTKEDKHILHCWRNIFKVVPNVIDQLPDVFFNSHKRLLSHTISLWTWPRIRRSSHVKLISLQVYSKFIRHMTKLLPCDNVIDILSYL